MCYSTYHRVMSQVKDDFEGFLKAQTEKEVIAHEETSLSVWRCLSLISLLQPYSLTHPPLSLSSITQLTHSTHSLYPSRESQILFNYLAVCHHRHHTHTHSLSNTHILTLTHTFSLTHALPHSLTPHLHSHSLCPSEQSKPSRVRARFCTGVACHVSPHDM